MMHEQLIRLAIVMCAAFLHYAPLTIAAERQIPTAVNIRAFTAEQDGQLEVLVRMPLGAVKNVQFPVRGDSEILDLAQLQTMLSGIAEHWVATNVEIRDRGLVLSRPAVVATRLSIISDPSFNSFASAQTRFAAPELATDEEVLWQQLWLDVRLRYPLEGEAHVLDLEPHVAQLGVNVTTRLTIVGRDGERVVTFEGDPGAIVLFPRWRDTATAFIAKGVRAVIGVADIALFVLCLALPFRRYRDVAPAAGAFVIVSVVSMLALRTGLVTLDLWWRTAFDLFAALLLLLLAAANVVNRVTPRRRALFALIAGLVFGVLTALRFDAALQYAGDNTSIATVTYALGFALTVIALIAIAIPVLKFLFSFGRAETLERIIVAALAADTAWGWIVERGVLLRRIPLSAPLAESPISTLLIGVLVVAVLACVLWSVDRWLKSLGFTEPSIRSSSESPA